MPRPGWKWLTVTNILAEYETELIKELKKFYRTGQWSYFTSTRENISGIKLI
jgi:hypothetical protein